MWRAYAVKLDEFTLLRIFQRHFRNQPTIFSLFLIWNWTNRVNTQPKAPTVRIITVFRSNNNKSVGKHFNPEFFFQHVPISHLLFETSDLLSRDVSAKLVFYIWFVHEFRWLGISSTKSNVSHDFEEKWDWLNGRTCVMLCQMCVCTIPEH